MSFDQRNLTELNLFFPGDPGLNPPVPHPGPRRPQSESGGRPPHLGDPDPGHPGLPDPGPSKARAPHSSWPHSCWGQPSPHRYLLPNCDI